MMISERIPAPIRLILQTLMTFLLSFLYDRSIKWHYFKGKNHWQLPSLIPVQASSRQILTFLLLRIWLNKGKVSTFNTVPRQLIFYLFYVCIWTIYITKRWKSLWRTDTCMELYGNDTAVCQGNFIYCSYQHTLMLMDKFTIQRSSEYRERGGHTNLQMNQKPISSRDQFSWLWICTPKGL